MLIVMNRQQFITMKPTRALKSFRFGDSIRFALMILHDLGFEKGLWFEMYGHDFHMSVKVRQITANPPEYK